jgi:hypothetical protein
MLPAINIKREIIMYNNKARAAAAALRPFGATQRILKAISDVIF